MTTLEIATPTPIAPTPIAPTPIAPAPAAAGPGRRASRLPRPYTIVTTGGMTGVMDLASALCRLGYRVPDFSVDVHEGVSCSCISCTVALTTGESADFLACVRTFPGVVSVEPA